MRIVKKSTFICFIFMLVISSSLSAQVQTLTDAQKEQLITALNYVEFSTAQIKTHHSRIVVDREFDFVINKIKRNIFVDPRLINTYTALLKNLTELRLQDNERAFYLQQAEKQRKQAIYHAFQSFGSVFVPGQTPMQMLVSLAYTGTSAFFNYKRALDAAESALDQQTFNINQRQLSTIDGQRTQLFADSTVLLSQYGLDEKTYTHENFMEKFIAVLQLDNPAEKFNNLKILEESQRFNNFPPFWYELGSAYQTENRLLEAQQAYQKFEQLQVNSIITYDKYYVELAKNMIELLSGSGTSEEKMQQMRLNRRMVYKYLAIIDEQTSRENTFDVIDKNYYKAQIYYLLGDITKAIKNLEENIGLGDAGKDYLGSSKFLLKIIKTEHITEKHNTIYNVSNLAELITFGTEDLHRDLENDNGYLKDIVKLEADDVNAIALTLTGSSDKRMIVNDYICFTIPNSIQAHYTITEIEVNGESKEPAYILFSHKEKTYHTYWCSIKWNDLNHDKNTIVISLKDNSMNAGFKFNYRASLASEGIVSNAVRDYYNWDMIYQYDGEIAVSFGQKLRDTKFEFKSAEDLDKAARKAAKKQDGISQQEHRTHLQENYLYRFRSVLQETTNNHYTHNSHYIPFCSSIHRFDAPPSYWKIDWTDWTFYPSALFTWGIAYFTKNFFTGNRRLNDTTDTFISVALDTISAQTGNQYVNFRCTKLVEIKEE